MDLKDIKSKKAKAVVLEFAWGLFTYSEYLSWHVSNTLIHYPSLILAILVVKSYGNSKENKLWVNFFYVLVWSEGSSCSILDQKWPLNTKMRGYREFSLVLFLYLVHNV